MAKINKEFRDYEIALGKIFTTAQDTLIPVLMELEDQGDQDSMELFEVINHLLNQQEFISERLTRRLELISEVYNEGYVGRWKRTLTGKMVVPG